MVGKAQELDKIDRAIKDAEIRLRTIKANVDLLDREINILSPLEAVLEENLGFLKQKDVIAIATEFKKAKDDLAKTKNKILQLSNDRDRSKKAYQETERDLAKSKSEFEKLQKFGENNVLQGKFGRKDNG